jgi:eukaryotic-like serine/threonine-protein kinase
MTSAHLCRKCGSALSTRSGTLICPACVLGAAESVTDALEEPDATSATLSSTLPRQFGDYELLAEIGHGGMGLVFKARQRNLDRIVALKVLLTGRFSDEHARRRFRLEAETAGRLQHPNIVAVYDVGEAEGHPYLTMEYVEGSNLAELCANQPLPAKTAARYLRDIARAIHAAHVAGVLHRDLKPSNVLVGSDNRPRVTDFGLARRADSSAGELTLTGQVLGSPNYVAPEQAAGKHALISAATDIYGLGALLYHLITGRAPFEAETAAEAVRLVMDTEPRAPRDQNPNVPRDLVTICLKCLRKEAAQRYASAAEVADECERFMADQPIRARPISVAETVWRWCRRRPGTATLAGVSAALLLCLAIGGPLVAMRLARATARAEMEAATSLAVSNFLQEDLLAQSSPDNQPDRDLKLRNVLDRAATKIDGRFPNQPLVEARIRHTLGSTYRALGEYAAAHRHAVRALELARAHFGVGSSQALIAATEVAELLLKQGKSAEAEKQLRPDAEALTRVLGPEHLETLRALTLLGRACTFQGKLTEGETIHRAGLAVRRRLFGPTHDGTLDEIAALAIACRRLNKLAEAETLNRELFTTYRQTLGPDHPETLNAMSNLSVVCYFEDKLDEAEELQRALLEISRRVLGIEHPDTLLGIGLLANTLQGAGKLAEAESLHREALALKKRVLGPHSGGTLGTMNNLALTFLDQKKFAEAAALYREVVEIIERRSGPEARDIFPAKQGLAKAYSGLTRFAEAEAILISTVAGAQRVLGPTHPGTLQCQEDLGVVYLREGKLAEAETTLRETIAGRTKADPTGWRASATRSILGDTLAAARRFAEAEPLLVAGYEDLLRQSEKIPLARRYATRAAERLEQFYLLSNQPEKAKALQRESGNAAAVR